MIQRSKHLQKKLARPDKQVCLCFNFGDPRLKSGKHISCRPSATCSNPIPNWDIYFFSWLQIYPFHIVYNLTSRGVKSASTLLIAWSIVRRLFYKYMASIIYLIAPLGENWSFAIHFVLTQLYTIWCDTGLNFLYVAGPLWNVAFIPVRPKDSTGCQSPLNHAPLCQRCL